MAFINQRVPVAELARALDLRFGSNGHIHCWHPERHKNGDKTASVAINVQQNYLKCFGRAIPPLHPINLVMDVRQIEAHLAAQWIAERFDVPDFRSMLHYRKIVGSEAAWERRGHCTGWFYLGFTHA